MLKKCNGNTTAAPPFFNSNTARYVIPPQPAKKIQILPRLNPGDSFFRKFLMWNLFKIYQTDPGLSRDVAHKKPLR